MQDSFLSNLDRVLFLGLILMYSKKKKLVEQAFEQAKKEIPNGSKTAIATYLSVLFEESFELSKDERTFVRYYKKLVEENSDYNIDQVTLDYLSSYLGYQDFSDFCKNFKNEPVVQEFGSVKVSISEEKEPHADLPDSLSRIVVNITNTPVFNIPEFVTKHKNSFGILGILILGGIFANNQGYFTKGITGSGDDLQKSDTVTVTKQNFVSDPHPVITVVHTEAGNSKAQEQATAEGTPGNRIQAAENIEKKCMYWDNDHYEAISCEDTKGGNYARRLDENLLVSLKKINRPDTLTVENAMGKVWYDKSNNKVEFFTHYGIHPVNNGKTLKPVSAYILEKYAGQGKAELPPH